MTDLIECDSGIQNLIEKMRNCPQAEAPVEHVFTEGLYTRVMNIPSGTVVVGKMHRHKTLNMLMRGVIKIYTGKNQPLLTMAAPMVFESDAGVQKVGYALTDTVWANVHITNETDLEKIEEQFIVPEEEYSETLKLREL